MWSHETRYVDAKPRRARINPRCGKIRSDHISLIVTSRSEALPNRELCVFVVVFRTNKPVLAVSRGVSKNRLDAVSGIESRQKHVPLQIGRPGFHSTPSPLVEDRVVAH